MEQDVASIEAMLNPEKLLLPEPHRTRGHSAGSHGLAQLCASRDGLAKATRAPSAVPANLPPGQAGASEQQAGASDHADITLLAGAPVEATLPVLDDAGIEGAAEVDATQQPLRPRGAGSGVALCSGDADAQASKPQSGEQVAGSVVHGTGADIGAGADSSVWLGTHDAPQTHQGRAKRRRQLTDAWLPPNMCALLVIMMCFCFPRLYIDRSLRVFCSDQHQCDLSSVSEIHAAIEQR